ncbi:MAG: hypothetical protein ACK5G0_08575 [Bacteroidota bacterium]
MEGDIKVPVMTISSTRNVPADEASPVAGVPSASPPVKTKRKTVLALLSSALIDEKSNGPTETQTPFPLAKVEDGKSVNVPPLPLELY